MEKEIVWMTRDGRKLSMIEIDNNHLVNIINMLERRFIEIEKETDECSFGLMPSEGSQAEQDFNAGLNFNYNVLEGIKDRIELFKDEAKKRGLSIHGKKIG